MFIWFLGIVGWIVGSFMVGPIVFLIGLLVMPIYSVLLVYSNLAPRDAAFTFIKEGTGIMVMRGDQFEKMLIAWKGYNIDPNTGDVVKDLTAKIGFFGSLKFWGIPRFQKIFVYTQSWTHLHENGDIKEHKGETLRRVLLKPDFYIFKLPLTEKKSAQDINGISIEVILVTPMRIVNPPEAFFGQRRWLAAISGTIKPVLKRFVAKYRYKEDLLDMKAGKGIEIAQMKKGITKYENGQIVSESKEGNDLLDKLWEEFKNVFPGCRTEIIEGEEYIRVYGVLIKKKGTDILEIETSAKYREMVTKEYEAEQDARMTEIKGKAQGIALTNKILVTLRNFAKQLAGINKKDGKLTKKEEKKVSEYMETAWQNYCFKP